MALICIWFEGYNVGVVLEENFEMKDFRRFALLGSAFGECVISVDLSKRVLGSEIAVAIEFHIEKFFIRWVNFNGAWGEKLLKIVDENKKPPTLRRRDRDEKKTSFIVFK